VVFFADLPNKVQSDDQDALRGHVLANGIDANGRMIAFAYRHHQGPDGSAVWVDQALVDGSVNAVLLAGGQAYPAFYSSLPATLRTHLAEVSRAARAAQPPVGLWPRSVADPDGAATVADLAALARLVVWPKLFRRVVPYLAAGFGDFDGFDAWLRARPGPPRRRAVPAGSARARQATSMTWCAVPGSRSSSPSGPRSSSSTPTRHHPVPRPAHTHSVGDVLIVAALPDPVGAGRSGELVTLLNTTAAPIDLAGWGLVDAAGGRQDLAGTIAGGAVVQVAVGGTLQLGNQGDAVVLVDQSGGSTDQVAYTADQVRPGRTICFGRRTTTGDAGVVSQARQPESLPKSTGLSRFSDPETRGCTRLLVLRGRSGLCTVDVCSDHDKPLVMVCAQVLGVAVVHCSKIHHDV
jgi:hypothetical protein